MTVAVFGALLFLPISPFLESRSISPTGKGILIALTQRGTSRDGADNSAASLLTEDSSGKRVLWFQAQSGLFQPSDYVWSKDGSILAVKLGWSATTIDKGYAQGKDYLKSVDVSNGAHYDVGDLDGISPPPSAAQLQVIPQLLKKHGGFTTANWSAPKKLSLFQLLTFR